MYRVKNRPSLNLISRTPRGHSKIIIIIVIIKRNTSPLAIWSALCVRPLLVQCAEVDITDRGSRRLVVVDSCKMCFVIISAMVSGRYGYWGKNFDHGSAIWGFFDFLSVSLAGLKFFLKKLWADRIVGRRRCFFILAGNVARFIMSERDGSRETVAGTRIDAARRRPAPIWSVSEPSSRYSLRNVSWLTAASCDVRYCRAFFPL